MNVARNVSLTGAGPGSARRPWHVASFPNEALEVFGMRLDVGASDVDASFALLSPAEMGRAGRFAFKRDRSRYIVARAWLRRLLSARLGTKPDLIELVEGSHGKPALTPQYAEAKLRFNVSHSCDVAVYAISRGREVGVDIEFVRTMSDADDIARRFFSRDECTQYFALPPQDRPLAFFNGWTRKEAFIKALGGGLSYPLDRFDVTLRPAEPARILRVEGNAGDRCGWILHNLALGPGLIGAVVVQASTEAAVPAAIPRRLEVCALPAH
jgi:4'-phosphopantetheinyl transferase